jgi:hypothetical protein
LAAISVAENRDCLKHWGSWMWWGWESNQQCWQKECLFKTVSPKWGGVPLHHCTSTWFIRCKDEFVNSNIAEFQIGHTQLTQCYIMEYQHISATFRDHNLASFLLHWDFVYCKQNKVP